MARISGWTICLLMPALLFAPVTAATGGSLDLNKAEKARARATVRELTRSVQQAAEGNSRRAAVKAAEAVAGYWIRGVGEDAPEWAKRIEFEWQTKEDDKPEWSVLTVQPLFQTENKRDTIFTQLRIGQDYTFNNHRTTTNTGFGYRRLVMDNRMLLGGNVFFDHEFESHHSRVGFGGELRWGGFDLYANYYEAITSKRTRGDEFEQALDGYDVELTGQLPYLPWARLRGKFFHFDTITKADNVDGFTASLEFDLHQNIQLEMGFSDDDNTRDGFFFTQIRFRAASTGRPVLASDRWLDSVAYRWQDMREHTLDKVRRENEIVIEKTVGGSIQISRGT